MTSDENADVEKDEDGVEPVDGGEAGDEEPPALHLHTLHCRYCKLYHILVHNTNKSCRVPHLNIEIQFNV